MDTLDGKVKWLKKNDDAIKEWVKKNFVLKGIHNDIKSFKVKLSGINNNRSKEIISLNSLFYFR